MSNSVPNLADDETEDRPSLIGSISRAMNRALNRRSSDAGLPPPPASPTATSPTQPAQPTAELAPPPPVPLRPTDNQGGSGGDGRSTKRGSLFKWLKDGVGSRSAEDQTSMNTRRKSDGNSSQTNAISAPRYTKIYEEMNRLTTDFRQQTVDNPLP